MRRGRARARGAAARRRGRGAARSAAPRSTRPATRCPPETLDACRAADAVLLGAGRADPEFDGAPVRPEQGLIRLRGELDVYANLRPARGGRRRPADRPRARRRALLRRAAARATTAPPSTPASTTPRAGRAHRAARRSSSRARVAARLTSVDKANVLETSRLWREVVAGLARDYPDVAARAHARRQRGDAARAATPAQFDVIVTENTFGDILSDVAAGSTRRPRPRGLGEPRRRRARHLRAGARLGARHRRARDREPGRDAPLASRCCSSTARGRAGLAAQLERGGRRSARRRRRRRDLGGSATTASSPTPCLTVSLHHFTRVQP